MQMMIGEFNIYKKYISSNSVCYDVGAHIGEIAFQMKAQGADVYAFEPSPNNFPILKNNCEHLGIKCFDVALHEKEYECFTPFKDCKTDYYDMYGTKTDTTQYIKYAILENLIKNNNIPYPNFIKMDIEGMESIVLKTFAFLFKSIRPIIYVEIHAPSKQNLIQNYPDNPHWKWIDEGGFNFNDLKKYNYNIIDPENEIAIDFNNDYNPMPDTHKGYLLKPV